MSKKAWWAGTLMLGMVLLANAGDDKLETFTGVIADSQCALNVHSLTRSHSEMMKNKNIGGGTEAGCARYCIKYLGGEYVLARGSVVYRIENQERVDPFAGEKVKITGTLEPKNKIIHVVGIELDKK